MAEENQVEVNTPTEGVDEVVNQAPQVSPHEARAMEQGWVPKDQWEGDPEDWRPAKEFLDRGELLKSISELKRELRVQREGTEELRKHHLRVREDAYKQALEDLKVQKKLALEERDADAVIAIDDKIAETREKQKQELEAAKAQPVVQEVPREFVDWQTRNSWYNQDRAMKAVADEVARDLVQRGVSNIKEILGEVDKEVRKAFPTKFENPNRQRAGAVEGTTRTGRNSAKDDVVMSDTEKAVMNKILRTGAITKEQYLKEFKARQGG